MTAAEGVQKEGVRRAAGVNFVTREAKAASPNPAPFASPRGSISPPSRPRRTAPGRRPNRRPRPARATWNGSRGGIFRTTRS